MSFVSIGFEIVDGDNAGEDEVGEAFPDEVPAIRFAAKLGSLNNANCWAVNVLLGIPSIL